VRTLLVAQDDARAAALLSKLASRGHVVTRAGLGDARLDQRYDMLVVVAQAAQAEAICRLLFSTTRGSTPVTVYVGDPTQAELERLLRAGVDMLARFDDTIDLALTVSEHGARDRALVADLTAELRESEERSRSIIAAMQEGVVVMGRDGKMITFNQSAERILGRSHEELMTRTPRDRREFVRSDGTLLEEDELPANVTLRTGKAVNDCVVGLRRASGETTWLSVSSQPLGARAGEPPSAVVVSITDLTELRRSEANFRGLIEHSPDGLWVHRDGKLLFVNPRFLAMLGYAAADECVGRPLFDFVHPDAHGPVRERVKHLREKNEQTPPLVERMLRKDGESVWVEVIAIPIFFDGAPAVLAHARDLTERRRLEAELGTADRLASVGRLAAAVGHEINNPLAYVVGNLDLLASMLDKGAPEETREARRLLGEAREGADRVRRIVRDLKIFSQRDAEERGPTDIRRVLESSIGIAWNEIRHRARLTKDYAPTPYVHGNEARLGQVFLNLLVNAAQAIPEGNAERHEVRVSTRYAPPWVTVEISDTGVGIAPDLLERIFEPFFTTKPAGAGTGLGLSICRTLVNAAGGEISIESTVGKGTTVRVSLPESSETIAASEPAPSPPRSSQPRYRILIVDDEPRVAITLKHLLSDHEVTMVSSGRAAIDALGKSDVWFDAIVCDLMMADLTGMDVYEVVKLARPGTEKRMIFMTGGAFTPRASAFVGTMENPCLEKPFPVDELLKAIRKVARDG